MKRVSFDCAKALKDAGYPQEETDYYYDYNECIQKRCNCYVNCKCVAPTCLETWLWLWKNGICIELKDNHYHTVAKVMNKRFYGDCPEEAIINAIEYLCEKDSIK